MDDGDAEANPDDLLAEGTVEYNEQVQCWVAEVDWSALRHASDEAKFAGAENGTAPRPAADRKER